MIALVSVAVATGLRWLMNGFVGDNVLWATFYPAVLAAAIWGGWVGAGVSVVLSPVAALILFRLEPSFGQLGVGRVIAFLLTGGLMGVVCALFSQTTREHLAARARYEAAQTQLATLVGELGHRAKNGFALMTAIAQQSARMATSVDDYRDKLISRFDAMSRSQDLIIANPASDALDLRDLLGAILGPFDLTRVVLANSSPPCRVGREGALALALVFHELATNATKYGALSTPEGRVGLDWSIDGGSAVVIWQERGGPAPAPAHRDGFGSRLFLTALRAQGGEAHLSLEATGAHCRVKFPVLD